MIAQYIDPVVFEFKKEKDLIRFIKEQYAQKIDYKKIKLKHVPIKICLVTEGLNPKDLFSYYKNDGIIEYEHFDVRKKIKKNSI
ncbi:MAG: hypothetical protein ACP5NV_06595 [Candidatus Woesearchaeota archaeon]